MAKHRKAWAAGTCLGTQPSPHFSFFFESEVRFKKNLIYNFVCTVTADFTCSFLTLTFRTSFVNSCYALEQENLFGMIYFFSEINRA
jgi:hypothetical protein